MIKDGDNLALSGFTPNGNPKAIFRELSQRAIREHEAGNPFAIGIFTGASSCQSVEGDMANAHAIKFRAPFSTNADFRNHVNLEEIDYEDMHLGHMAERMRHGFYGVMDWAVIEVSHYEIVGNTCRAYLTSAGGIVTTAVRLAKRVILEHNTFHNPNSRFLHDTYEPADCGFGRQPIPVLAPYDRVGHDYVAIDVDKIVGVIDSCIPEEARAFKDVDEFTSKMGHYVAEFLVDDMKHGRIPPQFLPIQSGVGATGNAVLAEFVNNLLARTCVYMIFYDSFFDMSTNPSLDEHRALLKALLAHDPDKAEQLMKVHLMLSATSLKSNEGLRVGGE